MNTARLFQRTAFHLLRAAGVRTMRFAWLPIGTRFASTVPEYTRVKIRQHDESGSNYELHGLTYFTAANAPEPKKPRAASALKLQDDFDHIGAEVHELTTDGRTSYYIDEGNPGDRVGADMKPDFRCRREMAANLEPTLYQLAQRATNRSIATTD